MATSADYNSGGATSRMKNNAVRVGRRPMSTKTVMTVVIILIIMMITIIRDKNNATITSDEQ